MDKLTGILTSIKKPSRKSVLFLCAVILMTMFIAAVLACVTMFIYADRYSAESRRLDQAVIETTSIAETLKASNGDLSEAGKMMNDHQLFEATENTLVFYYDDDIRPATRSGSSYRAVIEKTDMPSSFQYDITFRGGEADEKIYDLTFRAVRTGGGQ